MGHETKTKNSGCILIPHIHSNYKNLRKLRAPCFMHGWARDSECISDAKSKKLEGLKFHSQIYLCIFPPLFQWCFVTLIHFAPTRVRYELMIRLPGSSIVSFQFDLSMNSKKSYPLILPKLDLFGFSSFQICHHILKCCSTSQIFRPISSKLFKL